MDRVFFSFVYQAFTAAATVTYQIARANQDRPNSGMKRRLRSRLQLLLATEDMSGSDY